MGWDSHGMSVSSHPTPSPELWVSNLEFFQILSPCFSLYGSAFVTPWSSGPVEPLELEIH